MSSIAVRLETSGNPAKVMVTAHAWLTFTSPFFFGIAVAFSMAVG
jgi:hypothetical protein